MLIDDKLWHSTESRITRKNMYLLLQRDLRLNVRLAKDNLCVLCDI